MRKLILVSLFFAASIFFTHAQSDTDSVNDDFVASAEMANQEGVIPNSASSQLQAETRRPSFPGGGKALKAFLDKNVKYPETAKENGIVGTVKVQVAVATDGSLSDLRIVNTSNQLLEAAALEAVRAMPNWEPALEKGVAVKRMVTIPVRFYY